MGDDQYKAEKLTITFRDGHTEDFDVFTIAVADGLVPAARDEDGDVLYIAGENFSTRGITAIAATPEVVVALLMTVVRSIDALLDRGDPKMLVYLLEALDSMRPKETKLFQQSKTVTKHPQDN